MWRCIAAGLMLLALSGCGGSDQPEVVAVRGIVTFDGQPLPEALVEFIPTTGRPSTGVTDDQGAYELVYTQSQNGAITGEHKVKITVGRDEITNEGKIITAAVKEKLPAKYNSATTLKAEVTSANTEFDFDLASK